MSYVLRPITVEEVSAFRSTLSQGFGEDAKADDEEQFLKKMPLERTVGAFDGQEIVGTLGDYKLQLTVPGGAQLAMAGTTMVTVRATHTRKGILRSMMRMHLDSAVERGEPLAGLWASEPVIYGRFGFGMATECHDVKIDTRRLVVDVLHESTEVSMVAPSEVAEAVVPFWDRLTTQRVGFVSRDSQRWQAIVADPEDHRDGASASRHVVVRRGGDVVGYLEYRQISKWNGFVADGSIVVAMLVGEDTEAERALWSYATNIDLFPNVAYWDGATDDQLAYQVNDARSVQRVLGDALYLRILDLPAALVGRTYEVDGELVVAVADDMGYANGTYRITVAGGQATVTPTEGEADISLDVRELSALYLGRACADGYARSGLIAGSPESVRQLERLFVTARAPWCPEMF